MFLKILNDYKTFYNVKAHSAQAHQLQQHLIQSIKVKTLYILPFICLQVN